MRCQAQPALTVGEATLAWRSIGFGIPLELQQERRRARRCHRSHLGIVLNGSRSIFFLLFRYRGGWHLRVGRRKGRRGLCRRRPGFRKRQIEAMFCERALGKFSCRWVLGPGLRERISHGLGFGSEPTVGEIAHHFFVFGTHASASKRRRRSRRRRHNASTLRDGRRLDGRVLLQFIVDARRNFILGILLRHRCQDGRTIG
mmetsp:Transcript_104878/g.295421  ORF Transcript_104878/g.295421 Transcript_104878/m.295421 type:complete len:201 (-) Transcript_104878:1257-1859(-)